MKGFPRGEKIKFIEAYTKGLKGQTRYAAALTNNRVYWYTPGQGWTASSMEGYPP